MRLTVLGSGDASGIPRAECACAVCERGRAGGVRRGNTCARIEAGGVRLAIDTGTGGDAAAAALLLTGLTPTENTWRLRVVHALFQSVTARTAGFNTVDIGALPLPSLLILIGLMFIGGSPGSCAGGIKTTTAAVWSARVRSRLTGREGVRLFERHIPPGLVRRAALLLAIAGLWNMGGVLVLSMVEQSKAFRLEQLAFEQISAFATVGLSAHPGSPVSLSASFSDWGKLSIVFTMFMGRVGPLTLAVAVLPRARTLYRYPTERVMIG